MTRMLPVTIIALFLLAAPFDVRAQDDDANAIDDTPHITIVGTASSEVVPDLATMTLGVARSAPNAETAADAVATSARSVVDAAKAQGVRTADVRTLSVTLTQTYEDVRDPQGRVTGRRPNGFEASTMIAIRTHDLAGAGALAQGLIEKGANVFDGVAFSLEYPQPILDRLAAEAVANARRQAEMVARAAGVKLGRVLLIERPSPPPPGGPIFATARMASASRTMPIEAGTQSLAAELEVTWAIDQR